MPDRSSPPPLRHTLDFQLPQAVPFANLNGAQSSAGTALHIPSEKHSVLRVEFVFPAGKIHEAHTGVSHFTSSLLEKGTVSKSADAIAAQLDFHSAHLDISSGPDHVVAALYCMTRNLRAVLPLFLEILTEPAFDSAELRLAKNIFQDDLRVNMEKTSWLASRRINELLFGSHPYGSASTIESSESIETAWLHDHFQKHFRPSHVFVAGSILHEDLQYLREFLERTYGAQVTSAAESATSGLPPYAGADDRIPRSNAVQCAIRLGRHGIPRQHEDYAGLLITNHLFGGFFGSRLMKNIREEKGLTYGIYSSFQQLKHASMLVIGAEVNKENAELALDAIRAEMVSLPVIDEEELRTARHHFIGSLQNDVNTIFAGADRIRTIRVNGLPEDHFRKLIRAVDALSTEAVSDFAQRYFRAEDYALTVVG